LKITKRVKAGCALLLAGALVFPGMSKLRTEAAQAVDVDKQDCSITICPLSTHPMDFMRLSMDTALLSPSTNTISSGI